MFLPFLIAFSTTPQTLPADGQSKTITVTAKSVAAAESELAKCHQRICPPEEDITATVALIEAQYIGGNFVGARKTARSGMARNRSHIRKVPVEFSELRRAAARMALHLGLIEEARHETISNYIALRKFVGVDAPVTWIANAEMGDIFIASGRPEAARQIYAKMVRDARKSGYRKFEGFALLRKASLELQMSRAMVDGHSERATAAINLLRNSDLPEHQPYRKAAIVLEAIHNARNNPDALDDAIASLGTTPAPQLLYSPKIDTTKLAPVSVLGLDRYSDPRNQAALRNVEDNWFDVGFFIAPTGRVADVQLLRNGDKLEREWFDAVKASLDGRRYSMSDRDAFDPGVFRVERWSLTYPYTTHTSSRLVGRSTRPVISMIDLTQPDIE